MLDARLPLGLCLGALVAGCAGGCAEHGPVLTARLDPQPIAKAGPPLARPIGEAWQITAADLRDAQRLASVRLGTVRRPARLMPVPFSTRVVVPAGVTRLRLALAPASAPALQPDCRVQWQIDWSAGHRLVTSEPLAVASRDQTWWPLELRGRDRRRPTELTLQAALAPSCRATPVTTAVSQILAFGRAPPAARPNLLVVVVDALRRDRMDCGPTSARLTPHLMRRLCRRGLFFSEALSPTSWTYPAIASLHTGLFPDAHGAGRHGTTTHDVDDHVTTLAELLQWNGYQTAGFVSNPYAARGLWRGFDTFAERFPGPGRLTSEMRRADQMVDTVADWLRQERRGPFFAFLLLLDVHEPVDAAAKEDRIPPSCTGVTPIPYGWEGLTRIQGPLSTADAARLHCRNDLYDAALRFADRHLARLLDTLDELHLTDDTAVIVTSDHGEELLDHALAQRPAPDEQLERWGVDHGHTLYQELLRVPLLIVPPPAAALPAGERLGLVSLTDLFATSLGLAGLPVPASSSSRDLIDLVRRGQPIGLDAIVSQNTLYGPERVAVTTESLKAIRTGETMLVFDRQADPEEQAPLADDHPLVEAGARLLAEPGAPQP